MRKHYRGLMVAVLCLLLALLMIPVVGAAAADEGTTPEKGYFLTIYNADGTVGYTIDGTKSISDFCMKSAIADARVFVDNASLFGIKTPATYVIEMYEDSHENASFELGADVTINGNGHSIVLAEGVTLTNNATLNNVTIVDPSAPAVTVVTTGAELVDALENGGNVKLGADIALTAADDNDEDDYFVYIALYNDVTLDLNGYTLSCAVNPDWDDEYYYVVIFGGGHIVITDSVGTGKISARDQQISFEKSYANGAWTAAPTVTVEGGTIDSIALGEGGATFGTTGGNVTLYLYDLDYFYSEEEYDDYVKSLTFTSDPTAYCPEGYVVVDNGDGTYGFAEPYVAKIGNVGYETLEAAIAAAKDGDTVTLLANVAVANNNAYGIMISKAITIDGNGYTITVADGYSNSYALFYLYAVSGTVTVKNLTFDGVKSGAAIWAHDADLVVENCVFQNGTHTQIQGIVRTTCADLTVKNSKFLNNTCNFVITFNFDAAESDTMVVEGCEFIGNTVTDTAVIYYVAGASATIKDNLFEDNKITSAAAAVIYLSSTATVTGNAFLSNEVTGTGAAGDKCGVIATGSSAAGSVINGNAFAGNTVATTGANVVATVWVGSNNVNLSGNYWGGNEPEKGAAKDVYLAKSGLILDSYYTTYENGVLGGYTEILTYVAKVGNTYYTSLQDAIDAAAALTANNAVILIADCTADVVVSSGYFSIYFNGYTLTGTIKQVGGILTLTDSGKIKNTGLDGKYPIYHADGQMNIVGSFTVEATGENGVAFYVAGNKVNVDGNITVNGAVQTAPQGIMNISKGIFNGALIQATNSSLSVSGGSYKLDPASLLKGGFIATQEGGYYVVTAKPFSLDDLDVDTDGAYLIKTPEELISFRELAGTGGKASLSGKVFKLANNIDLAGYVLGPCCDDNNRFAGTFDGQGYKILNMVIEATGTTEVGFFGSTSGATIKNVIFENVTVTGAERVAAIVGRSRATTIENCKVTGTISITGSSGNVGAILGLGVATITDCTVSGTGTIEGAWGVGGIVGGLSAGSAEASNNTVEGITIKAKSGYAGGIAGRALNSAGATQVLANNLVKNVTIIVEEDTYVSSLIVGMTQTAATVTLDKNIAEGSTLTVAGVAKTNLYDAACEASENVTIIAPVSYVAKVGETYFVTLQDAIDAAVKNGGTVVLLSDVVLEAPLYIPAEKTLIIDGAGYKLTPAAGFTTNDHNAVIVLANGDRGYSANSNYTIKNLTFEGFTGISRVIRANFANVLIENCEFYGNTVRGGVITASFAELTVIGCTFDGNTVAGDAAYGVIDIGSDVGAGTTVVANIKNNTFTNNSVEYAVLFLFSSANVEGNYFASNVHIGSNSNAAAILAGPYTGNMAYTIKVTGNAFVNALGNLPAVYAEDWSSLGCTTAFDLSNNYWNGVKPVAGVAYATNVEAPTLVLDSYYTTYENGMLGGYTEILNYVAKVGETYFVSLQEAIDAAVKNGGTVVLLSDVVLEAPLYIPAEKTLIIDGAGYKLTPAAGFTTNDHNAVIVLANGDRGYSANSNYTIKNLTFEGFTGISRVIRANFANVLIENCEFYGNTVRGGVITSSFAELTVTGCTFDGNTVAGDAAYGVIDIGSDVGAGTTVVANIKNNKFTNNSVQYAVLFLFSSANVEGNYFASNVHIGSNPNAAAILAGPYTGRMAYTIKVTGNAFVNALGNLPAVYAEDWSSLGCTTAFDLSNNYWNGVKPVAGVAYATNVEAPTLVMSGYYTTYENGVLGGLTAIKKPQGNVAYRGYITDTDSREAIQLDLENVFAENSFVIKYYDANGNLLITTTYKYGGVDAANFTCNTVLWGSPSGSWNTEIHATLTTANVPAKVEIYADGILVDSYQHASGSVLADKLDAYLALDSVIKPTDSLLKIEHTSIVLNESFKFRFAFPASFFTDGIAGHYVVIDKVSAHDGSVKSVTLDTSSWYYIYIGSEKYYVVEFAGVTSKEMMDQLQVTVYGPDGNPVSETKHDSIHDYAERMFATSNDVTLKALLVDILNYGAEAQTYFGYATANLANKDLTDELKALATGARAYSGEMHSKTFAEGYSFTAANRLLLDNNIRLQAAFDLRALTLSENAKIRLSYVSSTGTSYVTEYAVADYDYKGDYIIISCDTLTPLDQNVKVSFEVIDGATTILTLTDSVEAYVARMGTGSLEAVCTALMQYCDSVKVYQSTLK